MWSFCVSVPQLSERCVVADAQQKGAASPAATTASVNSMSRPRPPPAEPKHRVSSFHTSGSSSAGTCANA
eukprot:12903383-Prorocentrum_lima.AAC.1